MIAFKTTTIKETERSKMIICMGVLWQHDTFTSRFYFNMCMYIADSRELETLKTAMQALKSEVTEMAKTVSKTGALSVTSVILSKVRTKSLFFLHDLLTIIVCFYTVEQRLTSDAKEISVLKQKLAQMETKLSSASGLLILFHIIVCIVHIRSLSVPWNK